MFICNRGEVTDDVSDDCEEDTEDERESPRPGSSLLTEGLEAGWGLS